VARVGLAPGDGGETQCSGLAVLFAGREPIAARAAGGIVVGSPDWEAIDAAGVKTAMLEPLRAWRVSFESDDATSGFDLEFRTLSEPAALEEDSAAAAAGGMVGYEQLCRVTGTVRARGGERRIDCLGQRGHSWGAPDWDRIELARTVNAWIADDLAVSLTAIRPAGAKSHADEALAASLFTHRADEAAGENGGGAATATLARAVPILEPRLSTTTDADGRQRRVGVELFEDEESYPHRASGEVICGTSLDLGRLRLDSAFFLWHMEGRAGVGRYDILRRTA
jgi:hypothetical protein